MIRAGRAWASLASKQNETSPNPDRNMIQGKPKKTCKQTLNLEQTENAKLEKENSISQVVW